MAERSVSIWLGVASAEKRLRELGRSGEQSLEQIATAGPRVTTQLRNVDRSASAVRGADQGRALAILRMEIAGVLESLQHPLLEDLPQ